jgi:cyclase
VGSWGWPFGDYPKGGVVRLGPHVTGYHAEAFPIANSAIVHGRDGTLVFDANIARFARRVREIADERAGPLTHLVLSHHHDDHSFGAMHFVPPARAYARGYVGRRLRRYSEMDRAGLADLYRSEHYEPEVAEEARDVRLVLPEMEVEIEQTIDLGGVRVRLIPMTGAAHTKGDLWAHVEPDDVVLCGDLWFVDCEPYLGSGSVAGAVRAVDVLRSVGAACYLPGHGPVGVIEARDPVERFGRWVLEATAAGWEEGLQGEDLRRHVREAFEAQRGRPEAVGFALELPGFLEAGVRAAIADLSVH